MTRLVQGIIAALLLLVPVIAFAGGGSEESPESDTGSGTQTSEMEMMTAEEFERQIMDPNIPQSWNSEPKKASELGITSFTGSPYLDARVDSGDLPPVEDRLPDDPPVIEPYGGIGEYGGTMRMYGYDLASEFVYYAGGGSGREGLVAGRPDGTGFYPWMAEDVELADDFRSVTITMREGLKWSDGTPFVAADEYDFYYNHTLPAAQVDPSVYEPSVTGVVILDDNTVRIEFGEPFPSFLMHLQMTWFHDWVSQNIPLGPAHVMRQYIPEFVGEEEALAKAEELGFNDVPELLLELGVQVRVQEDERFEMPTTDAYVVVESSETEVVMERNPYYPFVDTEGNQLPYIDRVIIRFAAQNENVELQAIAGDSDVLVDSAQVSNIPTYIENEEQGEYNTYVNLSAALNKPFYSFNFTPPEESEEYGPIFRDARFRKAMSLAINRDQVNDRFYFDRAIPMQVTASPTHPAFRSEFANAYIDYDPERAKELLDEVGLVDRNGDGFREFPNGDRFTVKMMYYPALFLSEIELHEYVITNWADVGIQVDVETVDSGSFWDRSSSGEWDMKPHLMDFSMPYPLGVVYFTTPNSPPEVHPFGEYAVWFRSDGEDGMEPPSEMIDELTQLFEDADEFIATLDDDAMERILESQAENLWLVGTVGFPPNPSLVAKRIKNVPEKILWEPIIGGEMLWRPQQWWIDE
ncbi:MAG: ABC transporter substrate-binding protein [Spirochaetota bacterium]